MSAAKGEGGSGAVVRKLPDLLLAAASEYRRSILGLAGLALGVILLLAVMGAVGLVNFGVINERWGTFLSPALLSVALTTVAFFIGFVCAMPLGLLRAHGMRYVRGPPLAAGDSRSAPPRVIARRGLAAAAYGAVTAFVEVLRGTPFFVQMFLVFFFVTKQWPHLWEVFAMAGLLALTINTTAYQSEVFRAGFQSVGQGQIDAAKALGMRGYQVFFHVTLPQSTRLVLLPLTNEWISLFKASTLLAYISVQELFFNASDLGVRYPIEGFFMVAVVYLVIIVSLSRMLTYVERKRRIPGLGMPVEVRKPRRRAL